MNGNERKMNGNEWKWKEMDVLFPQNCLNFPLKRRCFWWSCLCLLEMFHVNGTKHPYHLWKELLYLYQHSTLKATDVFQVNHVGILRLFAAHLKNWNVWMRNLLLPFRMWKWILWQFSGPTKGSPKIRLNFPSKCRYFWWSCPCLLDIFHVNGTKHPF